jgi:hypothetical protein
VQHEYGVVIAWVRCSARVGLGREQELTVVSLGGEDAFELLADGVPGEGTATVHVRDMIPVLDRSLYQSMCVKKKNIRPKLDM